VTAEIALLNRRAVTLAADSAMTLTVGPVEKPYNTADKIFELSSINPIGLMVYNNLDYMGYPLDLITKRFRDSQYCCQFDYVADAADAFLRFIHSDLKVSLAAEQKHISQVLDTVFQLLYEFFDENMERAFFQSRALRAQRRRNVPALSRIQYSCLRWRHSQPHLNKRLIRYAFGTFQLTISFLITMPELGIL
jgi:hypothetical protein